MNGHPPDPVRAAERPAQRPIVTPSTPGAGRTASMPHCRNGWPSDASAYGRPLTFAEKVLVAPSARPSGPSSDGGRSYADFDPDRVALQDALAQIVALQLMIAGLDEVRWCPPPCTATTSSRPRAAAGIDLGPPSSRTSEVYDFLRTVCAPLRHRVLEAGLGDHPPGRPGELRRSRRDDDRHRQPHPQRRRAGHGGRRGRRR